MWVEVGWVRELSVVVFFVECSSGVVCNTKEVIKVQSVGEVFVEVILEVLEKVHVLLDKIVSTDSWEREGLVIKLPGVDGYLWIFTLLFQFFVDLHGFLVVLWIEFSREVVKLNIKLGLRDINGWLASSSSLSLEERFGFWSSFLNFL